MEWLARTDEIDVTCGVDSYLIEDGWIRGQSIHYRVEHLGLTVAASALAGEGQEGQPRDEDPARMHRLADD